MRCACACSAAPLRGAPAAATAAAGAVTAAAAAAPGGRWCRVPRRPVGREGAAGRERGRRRRLRKAAGALKKRGRADPAADARGGERGDPPRAPCVRCRPGSGAERLGSRAAAADGEPATPREDEQEQEREREEAPRDCGAGAGEERRGRGPWTRRRRQRGRPGAAARRRVSPRPGEARRSRLGAPPPLLSRRAAERGGGGGGRSGATAAAASEQEGSPPGALVAAARSSSQYFLFGFSFASPQLPASPRTPTLSRSSVEAALGPGSSPPPARGRLLPPLPGRGGAPPRP